MDPHHILIIEDEPDLRETLKELFQLEGFKVLTASNGQEGLKALRESGKPCLIFLDLMMPIMSGWEFILHSLLDALIKLLHTESQRADDGKNE
jgi:CheY-like chemotaxis protein